MSVVYDQFKLYKELTKPVITVPKTVQDTIPVHRISEDGIFELEDKKEDEKKLYDKAYLFFDTNYQSKDNDEKDAYLQLYRRLLNKLNTSYKVMIFNKNRDMLKTAASVLLRHSKEESEEYQELVNSFNQIIEENMMVENAGIEKIRIFILSVKAKSFEEARRNFNTVEAQLNTSFQSLSSSLIPMDANDRIKLLHAFYNMGHEGRCDYDFNKYIKYFRSWKDAIAAEYIAQNDRTEDGSDHARGEYLKVGDNYISVLRPLSYPTELDDDAATRLSNLPFHLAVVEDISPLPKSLVMRKLQSIHDNIAMAINRQQEHMNKNMQFSAQISYPLQRERDEIEKSMHSVNEEDENMAYFGFYICVWGKSEKEIRSNISSVQAVARDLGFDDMVPYHYHQLEAFETCLPTAARFVNDMRTMYMKTLCAFHPFIVSELQDADGHYFGKNRISKNVITGNRESLGNSNAFFLGKSGFGKSVFTKLDMLQYVINSKDDVIIIDPMNEYKDIIMLCEGSYIEIGDGSKTYVNPMDTITVNSFETRKDFISNKYELFSSICAASSNGDLEPEYDSIAARAVNDVYESYFEKIDRNEKVQPPTISDIVTTIESYDGEYAERLALRMERFKTGGALDLFSHQSNTNIHNRIVGFGIQGLGTSLRSVGMLVMLEHIKERIVRNSEKGIHVRLPSL